MNEKLELLRKIRNIDINDNFKIVINRCYGGFEISDKLAKKLGNDSSYYENHRCDPDLIKAVEEYQQNGKFEVNGECSELCVVDIDIDDILRGVIHNVDGFEEICNSSNDDYDYVINKI